jgi:hypothetical protein
MQEEIDAQTYLPRFRSAGTLCGGVIVPWRWDL